jgi:hypothetical protein
LRGGNRRQGVETILAVLPELARTPSLYPFPARGKGCLCAEPFILLFTSMEETSAHLERD